MSEPSTPAPAPAAPARAYWGLLVAIALTILVADQVSKFLAVKHLTTAVQNSHAQTLGAEVETWLTQKHLMGQALMPTELAPVIPSFWSWRYAENPGAAWSFAAGWPENVRVPFFHLVSLLAIGLIAFYYRRLKDDQRLLRLALALVMGGALGNLVDRLIRGYVIDFVDWHLNDHFWARPGVHWPTFNVADTGISVGVALIAVDTVLVWWAARKPTRPAPARAADQRA